MRDTHRFPHTLPLTYMHHLLLTYTHHTHRFPHTLLLTYMHDIHRFPHTLLPRHCGLYTLVDRGRELLFVVEANAFSSQCPIHERYDLKVRLTPSLCTCTCTHAINSGSSASPWSSMKNTVSRPHSRPLHVVCGRASHAKAEQTWRVSCTSAPCSQANSIYMYICRFDTVHQSQAKSTYTYICIMRHSILISCKKYLHVRMHITRTVHWWIHLIAHTQGSVAGRLTPEQNKHGVYPILQHPDLKQRVPTCTYALDTYITLMIHKIAHTQGSVVGRLTPEQHKRGVDPILKDLDLKEKVNLGDAWRSLLLAQLKEDCQVCMYVYIYIYYLT
jgi:hypothetical protein